MKTKFTKNGECKILPGKLPVITLFLILSWNTHTTEAQVIITSEGGSPDPSAMLDVKSTSRGLLFPRMTLNQRTSIPGPPEGLILYQTDSHSGLYTQHGSGWKLNSPFSSPAPAQGSLLFIQEAELAWNSSQLFWDITNARLGIGTIAPQQKLSVTGTVESASGGVKFPDGSLQTSASRGCLITFAANLNAATQFLRPFGDVDAEDLNSSDIRTVFPVPLSGKIVSVAWRSASADNTTQLTLKYGGTYAGLILTGQNGLRTGLNYNVTAGQTLEVYHSSGTLPNRIILSLYLNE